MANAKSLPHNLHPSNGPVTNTALVWSSFSLQKISGLQAPAVVESTGTVLKRRMKRMLRHQPACTSHSQNAGSQTFIPQAGSWKEASLGNTKDQKAILLSMAPLPPASSSRSSFLPRLTPEQPAKDLQLSRSKPDSIDGAQKKSTAIKMREWRKQRLPRKVGNPVISDP